uniref:Mlh1_C domain-containing protein n=1 Tax=Strongyloides papillosus TaxID=174720 RepID=A0A0N5BGM8_STREA
MESSGAMSTEQKQINQLPPQKMYDHYKDRTNTVAVDGKILLRFHNANKDDFQCLSFSQDELKDKFDLLGAPLVKHFNLIPLKKLKDKVLQDTDEELKKIFYGFTFVGFSKDLNYLLIRHDASLFRLKFVDIFAEGIYQLFLFSFGNFNIHRLETENDNDIPSLECLLECYFSLIDTNVENESTPSEIKQRIEILMTQKDMLSNYFGILLETKNSKHYITAIPLLLENYVPHYGALARLVYNLVRNVDYNDKLHYIHQICRILSDFYVPKAKFFFKS